MITKQVEVEGSGKGASGWFEVSRANVSYDHPYLSEYDSCSVGASRVGWVYRRLTLVGVGFTTHQLITKERRSKDHKKLKELVHFVSLSLCG
jgi:hypothetical protein